MDKLTEALGALKYFKNYNNWLFSLVSPYLGDNVLEAGCGIGTMSKFLTTKKRLILLDNSDDYISQLKSDLGKSDNVVILKQDLNDDVSYLKNYAIDTVICVNLLEHTADDVKILEKFHSILRPGSRMIILVPAIHFLYSAFDRDVGHYRRYAKKELKNKITAANFFINDIFYFNALGAIGWFFSFKLLRMKKINEKFLRLFEKLIFLVRIFEKMFKPPFGMSLIAICEKPLE